MHYIMFPSESHHAHHPFNVTFNADVSVEESFRYSQV